MFSFNQQSLGSELKYSKVILIPSSLSTVGCQFNNFNSVPTHLTFDDQQIQLTKLKD